ncbi:hypothetical protein LJB42_001605 [Komagataella kurtzmanii]|nr:hypothetical protein LJB42_001605 [Komagataella kurtzmanii]
MNEASLDIFLANLPYDNTVSHEEDQEKLNRNDNDDVLDEFLDANIYDNISSSKHDETLGGTSQMPPVGLLQPPSDKNNDSNVSYYMDNDLCINPVTPPGSHLGDSTIDRKHVSIDSFLGSERSLKTDDSQFYEYERSREELIRLKFGPSRDTCASSECLLQISNENDVGYVLPSPKNNFSIPSNYLSLEPERLPYSLRIGGLPVSSRVETQIKIELSISPAPPQFLLHLPNDTIAKSKLCLNGDIPVSMQPHLLYLDTFVVTSDSNSVGDAQSCNVCSKCVRRELKRASRRKNGSTEDGASWSLSTPRRAIIFNCKEIVSFPAPTGTMAEKKIDLLSRIVCYCRHHQESKGFKLMFVLRNSKGEVLGKCFSGNIMIMDRKKNVQSSGVSLKGNHPLSPTSIDDSSTDCTQSQNETLLQGQLGSQRRSKRQKRPWSDVNAVAASLKKEPTSPNTADVARSPTSRIGSIASASGSSTTPDRNTNYCSSTSITSTSSQGMKGVHCFQVPPPIIKSDVSNKPTIQRIIPAQGPVRGGIEVTLLGSNFRPGLAVKFGSNLALATHCWSESTIVTYLPPSSQPGQVLVTFEDANSGEQDVNLPATQVFTYLDDSDRQLIELALQIVGLKMNGRLEDAKNIAKRIVGHTGENSVAQSVQNSPEMLNNIENAVHQEWLSTATTTVKELTKENWEQEILLLKVMELMELPNCPISKPNFSLCTPEGHTLLHLAAMKGYMNLVLFLIERGCKIDHKDINDLTPLHLALVNGQREVSELLIRCRASLSMKINNQVNVEDITDSNVLDLIGIGVRSDQLLDRRLSSDSLTSIFSNIDESALEYKVSRMVYEVQDSTEQQRSSSFADFILYDQEEEDADDENMSSDNDELPVSADSVPTDSESEKTDSAPAIDSETDTITSDYDGNKRTKLKLWRKVQNVFQPVNKSFAHSVDNLPEENLPSYDDLFPNDSSIRSLMKFTTSSFTKDAQERQISVMPETLIDGSVDIVRDFGSEEATKTFQYSFASQNSRKSVLNDKRLFFIWLPMLLMMLPILFISKFEMAKQTDYKQSYDHFVQLLRSVLVSVMLGKEQVSTMLRGQLNNLNTVMS